MRIEFALIASTLQFYRCEIRNVISTPNSHRPDPYVVRTNISMHYPKGPWLLPGRHSPSSLMGGILQS